MSKFTWEDFKAGKWIVVCQTRGESLEFYELGLGQGLDKIPEPMTDVEFAATSQWHDWCWYTTPQKYSEGQKIFYKEIRPVISGLKDVKIDCRDRDGAHKKVDLVIDQFEQDNYVFSLEDFLSGKTVVVTKTADDKKQFLKWCGEQGLGCSGYITDPPCEFVCYFFREHQGPATATIGFFREKNPNKHKYSIDFKPSLFPLRANARVWTQEEDALAKKLVGEALSDLKDYEKVTFITEGNTTTASLQRRGFLDTKSASLFTGENFMPNIGRLVALYKVLKKPLPGWIKKPSAFFSWEDFRKGKSWVETANTDDVVSFLALAHEQGICWNHGASLIENISWLDDSYACTIVPNRMVRNLMDTTKKRLKKYIFSNGQFQEG